MDHLTKKFLSVLAWFGGSLSLVSGTLMGFGYIVIKSKKYMMGFPEFITNDANEYIYTGSVFIFSALVALISYLIQTTSLIFITILIIILIYRKKLIPYKLKLVIQKVREKEVFTRTVIVVLSVLSLMLLFINLSLLKVMDVKNLLFQSIVNTEFVLRLNPESILEQEFELSIMVFSSAVIVFVLAINYLERQKVFVLHQQISLLVKGFFITTIIIHLVVVPIKYGFVRDSFRYPIVNTLVMDDTDYSINENANPYLLYMGENDGQLLFFTSQVDSKKRNFLVLNKSQVKRMELKQATNIFLAIRNPK